MRLNLKESIFFHSFLMNCIEKKNQDIFHFLEENNIDMAMNRVEEKEKMISLINKIQKNIEKLSSDRDGHPSIDIDFWYKKVEQWVLHSKKSDNEIISKLYIKKKSLRKEILNIHKKRTKFQGYNLNNLIR